ncbi:MAG: hypothetical protein M3T55_04760 [Pseudomonadota bacterium]|nr:hypothetical protein [Pseudomonadota bacterium]
MTPSHLGKTRLESWKEVATYFQRGERTVRRWELERGLPIRRLPGWSKSRIYADVAELEAWRRGGAAALAEPETAATAPNPPEDSSGATTRRRAPWLAGLAAVAIAAVALITNEPSLTGAAPKALGAGKPASLSAQRLYLAGMDDWAGRTPASLSRAVAEFSAAIARDPDYAEAYAGLAGAYDLMREYTLMPSAQAFPLAKAAAEHALALNDRVAAAHAALAFAEFYGDWDFADARAEFSRAIALDPRNETAHHWFATFLTTQGDNAGALREIDAALALAPGSAAIAADRDVVLYVSGQRPRAIAGLEALEAANPAFLSPHAYLAKFELTDGRDKSSLAEAALAARLTGDRTRLASVEAETGALRAGGHRGLLEAMAKERTGQFQAGLGSAFAVAQVYALIGDEAQAKTWLRLAFDRRETEVTDLAADESFTPLRSDTEFQRLEGRVRGR